MLTITPAAAAAVRGIVDNSPAESGGIRIAPGNQTPAGTALQLAVVDGPGAQDHTVEVAGASLFLEPTAAAYLDDKVLDATVEAGEARFSIARIGGPDTSQ